MDPWAFVSLDPWTVVFGFVFSVIGFGCCRYGKRESDTVMLAVPGLCSWSSRQFLPDLVILAVIGVNLSAGPVMASRLGG
jgi:hypothetical protein